MQFNLPVLDQSDTKFPQIISMNKNNYANATESTEMLAESQGSLKIFGCLDSLILLMKKFVSRCCRDQTHEAILSYEARERNRDIAYLASMRRPVAT